MAELITIAQNDLEVTVSGATTAPAPEPRAEPAAERPWERLDRRLAGVLAPQLPALAEEIVREIGRAIPEYRRPVEGAFGRGLRVGVQAALWQFLELIGRPGTRVLPDSDVYARLGRGELRAGRGLDALQGAYRVGARVAWRRVAAAARDAGADVDSVSLLAESIFAYIEEISAESVEGYAQAQAAAAGEQQLLRQSLVRLLVADDRSNEAVVAAAAEAGWQLPRTLAALVCGEQDVQRLVGRLGNDVIAGRVGEVTCALVPDAQAPRRYEQLQTATAGRLAALGPSVDPAAAATSFRRACQALDLGRRGILPEGRLLVVGEHLAMLVLMGDPPLARAFAAQRLAVLDELGPTVRGRLQSTLAAWLARQGGAAAVAADLHVHPQTVRYRLGRLRELFGAELDDPQARFEIELALRARAALAREPAPVA